MMAGNGSDAPSGLVARLRRHCEQGVRSRGKVAQRRHALTLARSVDDQEERILLRKGKKEDGGTGPLKGHWASRVVCGSCRSIPFGGNGPPAGSVLRRLPGLMSKNEAFVT